jgi:hypothetical protein
MSATPYKDPNHRHALECDLGFDSEGERTWTWHVEVDGRRYEGTADYPASGLAALVRTLADALADERVDNPALV